MTIADFIPTVWSASILKNFDRAHVASKMTNRDYEGEIGEYGSSVKIAMMGDIATSTYAPNTDLATPELIDIAGQFLKIDQGDTINFYVDNLDKRQARAEFRAKASQRAAYSLANKTDYFLFTTMANGGGTAQTAATVGLGAGQKSILEYLALMQVTLDEADVMEDGRIAFLPPWTEAMLRLDERFTGFNTPGAGAPLRGQPIGRAMGFDIFKSNNLPRASGSPIANTGTGAYTLIAGHPDAVTFGEQIDKMVPYSPEKRFGDAVKGLHVYGATVLRPDAITTLVATRGDFV